MGKKYGLNEPVFYYEPHIAEAVFNEMLAEAKVQTRFQLHVDKVAKKGAHIQSLALSDGSTVQSKDEFNEEAAGIRLDTQHRQAATMNASGKLLPGISARVADLTPGAGDRKTMNYNFRLSLSNKPENKVPIPAPSRGFADARSLLRLSPRIRLDDRRPRGRHCGGAGNQAEKDCTKHQYQRLAKTTRPTAAGAGFRERTTGSMSLICTEKQLSFSQIL